MYLIRENNEIIELDEINFDEITSLAEIEELINYMEEKVDPEDSPSSYEILKKLKASRAELKEVSYKEIPKTLNVMAEYGAVTKDFILSIKDLNEYMLKKPDEFVKIVRRLEEYGIREFLSNIEEEHLKEFANKYPEHAYKIFINMYNEDAVKYIVKYLPKDYLTKFIKERKPSIFAIKRYLVDENLAMIYFIHITCRKFIKEYAFLMKYHDINKLYEMAKPYLNPEDIEFVEYFKSLGGFEKVKGAE